MTKERKRFSAKEISKSLLFKTLSYRAAGLLGKPAILLKVAQKAMNKADKEDSFQSIAEGAFSSFKSLVALVKAYANGSYRGVSKQNMILVVAAILYFVTPIDIVPDFIPLLGWLDDITIMGWVIKTIGEELSKFEDEHQKDEPAYLDRSYAELYEEAKSVNIHGRSGMNKSELASALRNQNKANYN
jgi:uncharacterized membrane protein YkvA (DUF1232 family)